MASVVSGAGLITLDDMKAKRLACLGLLALGVFYFFRVHAGDSISDFARRNFQFDLAQMQFGTPLEKFSDLRKAWDNGDNLSWHIKTNSPAGQKFQPSYGFRENVLVAVEIGVWKKEVADKILADFTQTATTDPTKKSKYKFHSEKYEVHYEGLCNPTENIGARLRFTLRPVAK